MTSTYIAVFDLTILVRQGSCDVYQLTEHGIQVLVFIIIIIIVVIVIVIVIIIIIVIVIVIIIII